LLATVIHAGADSLVLLLMSSIVVRDSLTILILVGVMIYMSPALTRV